MNTSKILDMMPQPAAATSPAPVTPARPDPHAVSPISSGTTADLIQQRAQRQAEAAESERKHAAAKPVRTHNFNREVGLVDDSFDVFVDLVNSTVQDHRFRIFGPSDPPPHLPAAGPTGSPAAATAAYAGTSAAQPTVKTDV